MNLAITCPSCGYHIKEPAHKPYKLGVLPYQVAQLLMLGKSNGEIAQLMSTSESAIKAHIYRLMNATGSENRTQLVIHLRERGCFR